MNEVISQAIMCCNMSQLEQTQQEKLQQEVEKIQQNKLLKQQNDIAESLGTSEQHYYSNLYKLPQIPRAYSVRRAHSKNNLIGDVIPEDSQVNFSNELDGQGYLVNPGHFSQRSFSDTNLAQMSQNSQNYGSQLPDTLSPNVQSKTNMESINNYEKIQDLLRQTPKNVDQYDTQQGITKASSATYLPKLANIKTSTENLNSQNQPLDNEEMQKQIQQGGLRQQLLRSQQSQINKKQQFDNDQGFSIQQLDHLQRQISQGGQHKQSMSNVQAQTGSGSLQNINQYLIYQQQLQQQQQQQQLQQQYMEALKELFMKGQITINEAQNLLQQKNQQLHQNQQAQLAGLINQQQTTINDPAQEHNLNTANNAYVQKMLPHLFNQQLGLDSQQNFQSQPNLGALRQSDSVNSLADYPQNSLESQATNKQFSANDLMLAQQIVQQNATRNPSPSTVGSFQNLNYLEQLSQLSQSQTRGSTNESELLGTLLAQQGARSGKDQSLNLNELKQQLEGLSNGGMRSIASAPSLSQLGQAIQDSKLKEDLRRGSRISRRMLDPNLEAQRKAQQDKMFKLNCEKVINGEDKRTTLMVKNIPNKYTQKMLIQNIDQEFQGQYDFLYLPIDFKNRCNVGYAFVNMVKPQYIVSFFQKFHEQKWERFNSEKVASITYARIQGIAALVAHFQNSSLMHEDKKYRPILMKNRDGNVANDPEALSPGSTVKPKRSFEGAIQE